MPRTAIAVPIVPYSTSRAPFLVPLGERERPFHALYSYPLQKAAFPSSAASQLSLQSENGRGTRFLTAALVVFNDSQAQAGRHISSTEPPVLQGEGGQTLACCRI